MVNQDEEREMETKPADAMIRKIITKCSKDGQLPCAQAFAAADELGVEPGIIGDYADEMGLKLNKCQLGLFGYLPEKRIVKPREPVEPELKSSIMDGLSGGRLPCETAWRIADRMGLRKMEVSGACETLGIRIKPCQLGAF